MRRRIPAHGSRLGSLDAGSPRPADGVHSGGARRVRDDDSSAGLVRASAPGVAASAGGLTDGLGRVFMPTGYEPGYAYPLLVWIPDRRRSSFDLGRTMARVSLRNHVAVQPVLAADDDVEAAVWNAIDRVRERVSIHPRRVFLVGQGRGGTDAFRIACRHATAFGGAVSIGGAFPHGEGLFSRLGDVRRLPMLFCCRRDSPAEVVRPTDATLRLFHAAGATLAMRIYPGRNDLSSAILADVNRWLMDEICGTSDTVTVPCAG